MRSALIRQISLAFKVSRVRFWLYLGGTFMVGYLFGATSLTQFTDPLFLLELFYFIIPANIFLYGINDLADQDTDFFNSKKEGKEIRIEQEQEENDLKRILLVVSLMSLAVLLVQPDVIAAGIFSLFFLLSFAYSYPPFRFKARPVIDFSSNILYALPGVLAYYQMTGSLPSVLMWFALYLWTGAMHLFSAIPDIDADRKVGVTTTAVKWGKTVSLWLCLIFWTLVLVIVVVYYQVFTPFSYIGFLYPLIPLSLLIKKDLDIDRIYWLYPYINNLLGLMLSVLAGWDLLVELIV